MLILLLSIDGDKKSTPAPSESKDPATSSSLLNVDDGEFFVKFEDDEEKKASDDTTTATNDVAEEDAATMAAAAAAAATMPLDLSKTFNLAALQQISAAFPGVDLTKALTAYMQSVSNNSGKSDNPTTSASDIKTALARFPALEALLRKDPITNTTHNTNTTTSTSPAIVNTDQQQQQQPVVVHTIMPTNPTMYITVAENVAVCIAVLAPPDTNTPEYRIMRRLDTNYINGTTLLTAGGIDTDSERSMILSFEMERRRIPEKKSALYGTWIPLRRAQELAVTCSIQHRLGPFLTDSIESYFPSPLPITIHRRPQLPSLKESSNNRWASLARRALRNGITHPDNDDTTASTSSSSTSNTKTLTTATAAQLHQLLLTNNPRKIAEYAQKAPLLGTFGDDHENSKRKVAVIDASSVAARAAAAAAAKKRAAKKRRLNEQVDHSSDVDIENSGSEAEAEDDEGEDTDTDTDVEEVRKRMKRMRDAAIDAMESGSSIDLEELIRRASSPIMSSGIEHRSGSSDTLRRTATVRATSRRRPQARHGNSTGGKIAPSNLKKSASWSGSLTSPLRVVVPSKKSSSNNNNNHRRSTHSLRPSKLRGSTSSNSSSTSHHDNNRVVEHTSSSSSSPSPTLSKAEHPSSTDVTTMTTTATTTTPPSTKDSTCSGDVLATIQEDDEDEEIDIGGSDRDDDLR